MQHLSRNTGFGGENRGFKSCRENRTNQRLQTGLDRLAHASLLTHMMDSR